LGLQGEGKLLLIGGEESGRREKSENPYTHDNESSRGGASVRRAAG
jgi:hypothetical protein